MPTIHLETIVHAPIQAVFDLARSVEAHLESTSQTHETVASGKAEGLFELNDKVTWKAKHFGLWHTLTVKITHVESPVLFVDEMVDGPFRSMRHTHRFEADEETTKMTDDFEFELPFGPLGKAVAIAIVAPYLKGFLITRNQHLQGLAEGRLLLG